MYYEGMKETENTRIEKDDETRDEIDMLYSFGVVLFEHTILKKDEITISICYCDPLKIYDIVIENNVKSCLLSYKTLDQLDEEMEIYFNLTKNEEIVDKNNVKVRCMSHSVEYTL
ncbi:MAG TPA: hypothetical protein HA355_00670 [Methanosphaera sp.]|nr:hypothetical protein [Methanosphaera sp.]